MVFHWGGLGFSIFSRFFLKIIFWVWFGVVYRFGLVVCLGDFLGFYGGISEDFSFFLGRLMNTF